MNPAQHFADFAVHPKHPNLIVCTTEDHTNPHPAKVVSKLCTIDTGKGTVADLVQGADFYACARFSPDGKHLVWQQWSVSMSSHIFSHPDHAFLGIILNFPGRVRGSS